ncbi:MAG: hypothetical protein CM1200mP3_17860 [Chloroflexota bacterium]|nr:MAG: hypothetical protein CM1200mP3_17860 [Chloroflexota bacterium]
MMKQMMNFFMWNPDWSFPIDDNAIKSIQSYYSEVLPENATVLDLMSSWKSHFPTNKQFKKTVGLGLNAIEMENNPRLDEFFVQNINVDPTLPFKANYFDAVVIVVSIQYVSKPIELFQEIARILKPDSSCHVIYSNRMFPTKAVWLWKALSDDIKGSINCFLLSFHKQLRQARI